MRKAITAIIIFVFILSCAVQAHAQTFSWHDPILETVPVVNGRAWGKSSAAAMHDYPNDSSSVFP